MRELLAYWMMRLAISLGAEPPPRVMILVRVAGKVVLLMNDAQAVAEANMAGGSYVLPFGGAPAEISLTPFVHARRAEK